jgi:hypothetical protein
MRIAECDLNFIRKLIQNGEADLVETQSNRVTLHDITFRGERMRIVYDKVRKVVVTVLPKEVVDGPVGRPMSNLPSLGGS